MNDVIRQFGNVTIDVRKILCIGSIFPISGSVVGVDVFLEAAGKVVVEFDSDEQAKKDISWLITTWKQATK
jgi:hypothetical protein